MKFHVIRDKSGHFLRPADPKDADAIRQMRPGEIYRAEVKMPRNVKFHRKFFSMLHLVFENIPEGHTLTTPDGQELRIRSVDDLLWHIKMQLGHYEQRVTMGGRVTYEAKSISFGAMDEAEFSAFYDGAIAVVLKYILPGVDRRDLEEEIAMYY